MKNRHCAVTTAAFGQGPDQLRERIRYLHYSYQPNRLMSTGFVPSSVSTVCASPGNLGQQRSRGVSSWLANERKVSVSTHRQALAALSSTARCCARICPGFRRSAPRPSRRLPVVLTPDEVVRILGFLEGEHRLFAQLLYGTGMRISEGLQLRVKDLDFDHGTIIAEGRPKDRPDVTRELAPSLREQLSRTGMVAGDCAEGRSAPASRRP